MNHIFSLLIFVSFLGADELNGILREMDRVWYGDASEARMQMDISKEGTTRELKIRYWARGKTKTLALLLSPVKERGIATLKNGEDVHNYLPRVDQLIKISSALRGSSWMGSHFTNDDIVRSSTFADDFAGKIAQRKKTKTGDEVLTLDLKPRPNVAVPWARVVVEFNKSKVYPLRQAFFDEKGKERRVITFSKPRTWDGRSVPSEITLRPSGSKEFTRLVYTQLDRHAKVDDAFFSLVQLKQLQRFLD